ncbi:MAG: hypothetical protein A2X56_08200 [Nitrospirae bacterium GWC2_57_13]|nr:MAG: hypothetical protein A2X56_08200 [Nitrospirae bacterium GWC2_57_13]
MRNIPTAHLAFFHEYLRNIREVGAIGPDSRDCVESLLRPVPFSSARVILEFGSASGAVTRELIRRKKRDTLLICFEKNAAFYGRLARDIAGENVFILNRDVFGCESFLRERFGLCSGDVDCIVSTLPCSSLEFVQLLEGTAMPLLSTSGVFIQYMHTLSALKGFRLGPLLRGRFTTVTSEFVFRNLPPALVYACTSPIGRTDANKDRSSPQTLPS